MATVTFKGATFNTSGAIPTVGAGLPPFELIQTNLSEVTLHNFSGKKKIINIFPSVDTAVCAMSVRRFNEEAASLKNVVVLNVSADLPFAHRRFCGAEGIEHSKSLSAFRSTFGKDYGVEMIEGPLKGMFARVVIVTDEFNRIVYVDLVSEIGQEPSYENALKAVVQP